MRRERQALYALVAGGFVAMVALLTAGAGLYGLVPVWWTVVLSVFIVAVGAWLALNWRRTGVVLLLGIGLFVAWMIGTLVTAGQTN